MWFLLSEISAGMFFHELSRVLQSYLAFNLLTPIDVNIIRIPAAPTGSGRKIQDVKFEKSLMSRHCVVSVKNTDRLCFARCIVVGMAYADGLAQKVDKSEWKKLSDARNRLQSVLA